MKLLTASLLVSAMGLSTGALASDLDKSGVKIKMLGGINKYEDSYSGRGTYGYTARDDSDKAVDASQVGVPIFSKHEDDLASFGFGLEYEMSDTFGIELRHYMGMSSDKSISGEDRELFVSQLPNSSTEISMANDYVDYDRTASLQNATSFLFNAQTPEWCGLSAYAQFGPSVLTNNIAGIDVSESGLAYGVGFEYRVNDKMSIVLDALILPENYFNLTEDDVRLGEESFKKGDFTYENELDLSLHGKVSNKVVSLGAVFHF